MTHKPDVSIRDEGRCISMVCKLILEQTPVSVVHRNGYYEITDLTPKPPHRKYAEAFRE